MRKINCWFLLILLVGGCQQQSSQLQGYVEGRFAYISANFSGVLKQLLVERGTQVTVGQSLFVLEQQPESNILMQAQAKKAQAEANLRLAEVTFKRREELFHKRVIQEESLDTARNNLAQARAQLTEAIANLEQSHWASSQKIIKATDNASVVDTFYLPGELVPAGHPVLSLLQPSQIKIIFFVPEQQLSQIKLHQTVAVNCDNCENAFLAKINFISPQSEYTPPVIYSNETRAKLVYRIEATLDLTEAIKFHPGQPVSVTLRN